MKLLKYYLLNRIVKDPVLTAQIYNMIYYRGLPPQKSQVVYSNHREAQEISLPTITEVKNPVNSRKQEMLNALKELKNKPIKSKQDKDSIGILETVLKNGYE